MTSTVKHNTHICNCLLPSNWSYLVSHHPSFLITFSQIYLHATDMERQQSEKAMNDLQLVDRLVNFVITLPRLLFIQLITTSISSGSRLQGVDHYRGLSPYEK